MKFEAFMETESSELFTGSQTCEMHGVSNLTDTASVSIIRN
jgi:hypothetical protein